MKKSLKKNIENIKKYDQRLCFHMGYLKHEFDYKKHDKIEISKKKMLIVINGITTVSALKTGPKLTVLTERKK